jgi:serine/threonine protein kinase
MNQQNRCTRCGTELGADAPQGLCPACLLKRALESQSMPSDAPGRPEDAEFVPPTPTELAGHFPELEILEFIGRGGMGMVYKARQKHLDRPVALKILLPKVARDPAFAERFAREARAMALLAHPNIVTVHDFGQTYMSPLPLGEGQGEGPLYYFIMEFVDGVTLRKLLETGKLDPKEALAIVPQICDALQYAHDKGVVHRDIKPENILLDKSGRVKIADFGLAKLVARQGQDITLTGAGQVMGTPHYMAPEQTEHPQEVDHRADIYSLGVIFYQMLTGELPIGRFAPPSKKVQIDVRLDEVVLRALEKEPEQRYQQASEIKTRVETIVTTPPDRVGCVKRTKENQSQADQGALHAPYRNWRSWVMGVGVRSGRKVINWPVLIAQWLLAFIVFCSIWVFNQSGSPAPAIFLEFSVISAFLVVFFAWIQSLRSVEQLPSLEPCATEWHMFGVSLVGIRSGQRVVHWPGVWLVAALLFFGGLIVEIALYILFAFIWHFIARPQYPSAALEIWGVFLGLALLFVWILGLVMLVVKIHQGLSAPIENLPRLDTTNTRPCATTNLRSVPGLSSSVGVDSSTPAIEQAQRQVKWPAIGLLITGMLSVLILPMVVLICSWEGLPQNGVEPQAVQTGAELVLPIVLFLGEFLGSIALSTLIIVAAIKMKRLQAYGLAVAAGILAIISSPTNLIGLPIGIWALVVLSQQEVRAAFKRLRPARSRPVLRAVIVVLIILMVVCLVCVVLREAWEESLIPKQARLAAIEQAYRPQLEKLAGFAYDYDRYAAHPPKDEETKRLFAEPSIIEAAVYDHTFGEGKGGGFDVKTEENPPASVTGRLFRNPSIGKPVVNLYFCGDRQQVEYRAIVVDRKGIERSYDIRFDPSKMDELDRAPAAVAEVLEEYRRMLVSYDLSFDSVFPQQKWTRYDASRLEMYPTRDAWPNVLGHVHTNPGAFRIVSKQSPFLLHGINGPFAFMVPLDRGLVADRAYTTLLFLRGISPQGTVVAKTYASLVCMGPMEGRLNFDSYATALIKGDLSGQITSQSYFNLVVTGKFTGRIYADSYAMIYLMGGCDDCVEVKLRKGARVYIAGRTAEADLSKIKGKGEVFLEDSDLAPGIHTIGDLSVTVDKQGAPSDSNNEQTTAVPPKSPSETPTNPIDKEEH